MSKCQCAVLLFTDINWTSLILILPTIYRIEGGHDGENGITHIEKNEEKTLKVRLKGRMVLKSIS